MEEPTHWKDPEAEGELVRCIVDSVDMNLSKLWEIVEDRAAWQAAVHGVAKGGTPPSD